MVGQQVKAHANVMFSSVDAVEAAQSGRGETQFYVYVLSGFDSSILHRAMPKQFSPNWWSLGDANAIQVGRVVLGGSQSNLALANASFRVPELPPGTYAVMFCDHGCVHPLADVIPNTEFTVVADPMVARLAVRLDRLELQAHSQAQELLGARAEAREAQLAASGKLDQVQARIQVLERRLADSRRSPWTDTRWLVTGLVLGVVVGLLLWRRRPGGPTQGADWQIGDDELSELLSAEPPRTRS